MFAAIREVIQTLNNLTLGKLAAGQSATPALSIHDWAPPPNRELGDFAIPCFKLSKSLGKKPNEIAVELAHELNTRAQSMHFLQRAEATGPYINCRLKHGALFEFLKKHMDVDPDHFGGSQLGSQKTVIVEFSSPNVAKEIGVHHLRSTAIGNSLAAIAELHGYNVIRLNYLGDWGTTFGKYLVALSKWGSLKELQDRGVPYMMALYVRFNQEAKDNPSLDQAARQAFKDLEDGRSDYVEIWKTLRELSIADLQTTYDRLGVHFDYYDGEAMYVEKTIDRIVKEIDERIGTRISDGATVADLPGHKIPVLLRKNDGASLYITRDIAAIDDRVQRFRFDEIWYVVAIQQKLHFQQLKDLLSALGKPYADRIEHVSFGMLSFGSRTMATREGNILRLKECLDEGYHAALKVIQDKNPDLDDAASVAEMIGTGAFLFFDLSQHRQGDIKFDWERALSFEGDTAPMIQYTYARGGSLIERAEQRLETLEPPTSSALDDRAAIFEHSAVRDLVTDIALFETFALKALQSKDPSQIAIALLKIAKSMNQMYHQIRFVDEHNLARLRALIDVVELTRQTLKHGLKLLGIRAPERM